MILPITTALPRPGSSRRDPPVALAASVAVLALACSPAAAADYTWNVLGGGTQSWSTAANWNPSSAFPNATSDNADLRVGLTGNLALDLGASGTVTTGSISFGGQAVAVTTDVTSSGGALVLNSASVNAQILSQGVAGSVNRISAPLILGKATDLLAAGTRDFAITGTLGQVGAAVTFTNQMSGGPTLTIGSGSTSRIQLYDSLTPATGRNLILNNLSTASGSLLILTDLASTPKPFIEDTTIFALINYSGTWNGGLFTYGSTVLTDGSRFTVGSQLWEIDYNRTSSTGLDNFTGDYLPGSSFVAITAVPEPSTYAMALAGLACGGCSMWRRRKWA